MVGDEASAEVRDPLEGLRDAVQYGLARMIRPRVCNVFEVERYERFDPEVDIDLAAGTRIGGRCVEHAALDIVGTGAAAFDKAAAALVDWAWIVQAHASFAGGVGALLGDTALDVGRIVRTGTRDGEGCSS